MHLKSVKILRVKVEGHPLEKLPWFAGLTDGDTLGLLLLNTGPNCLGVQSIDDTASQLHVFEAESHIQDSCAHRQGFPAQELQFKV